MFGELSILNVPGSKVAILISSHREEKKERGKSSYTFGEDKSRLAGWHQLYSVPLTSWGRERKTVFCGKILLIETNANCRHLKILTCKRTSRQVFFRVYRLEIQSWWYFLSQLCDLYILCCPSPLLFGSTVPPSPFPV